jgi:hypothetical protein
LQHYAGWNVGLRTLPPFGIFFVKVCSQPLTDIDSTTLYWWVIAKSKSSALQIVIL